MPEPEAAERGPYLEARRRVAGLIGGHAGEQASRIKRD